MVLNESVDLTFRDYKKALRLQNELDLMFQLATDEWQGQLGPRSIVFASTTAFDQSALAESLLSQERSLLIVDEFDSAIFTTGDNLGHRIATFRAVKMLLAFSGSDLLPHHVYFLQNELGGSFYDLRGKSSGASAPVCHGIEVLLTVKDFVKSIVDRVKRQSSHTPVIIIASDQAAALTKPMVGIGVRTEVLRDGDKERVEASLAYFSKRQNGLYPCFIVGENQGRGLDFSSNSEIEVAGGVYLIVATLPKHYLQF